MLRFGTSLLMIAATWLLSMGVLAGEAQYGEAVEGSSKAAKLDACVRPTPEMRRSHFTLIQHQRDITVRQGIRKTDDSLAGCIDCHANKDAHGNFVPVNEDKQFCAGCHQYTGVMFDCFSCHSTTPSKTGN